MLTEILAAIPLVHRRTTGAGAHLAALGTTEPAPTPTALAAQGGSVNAAPIGGAPNGDGREPPT